MSVYHLFGFRGETKQKIPSTLAYPSTYICKGKGTTKPSTSTFAFKHGSSHISRLQPATLSQGFITEDIGILFLITHSRESGNTMHRMAMNTQLPTSISPPGFVLRMDGQMDRQGVELGRLHKREYRRLSLPEEQQQQLKLNNYHYRYKGQHPHFAFLFPDD